VDFNVRVWFAVQAGVPEAELLVKKAERTTDGEWEFGLERSGRAIGAVVVSDSRQRMNAASPTRLVVATWGVDRSATLEIGADREIVWG
jgi:hypothetical protein